MLEILQRKMFLRIFVILVCLFQLNASADNLQHELSQLRQRKADFKRDRAFMLEAPPLSKSERSDLKAVLKKRELDIVREEKLRKKYVQSVKKNDENEAEKRELIEQKIQERDDEKQLAREKKFARAEHEKNRIIKNSGLEIDGSSEYGIHIPKKEDHAKARSGLSKKPSTLGGSI